MNQNQNGKAADLQQRMAGAPGVQPENAPVDPAKRVDAMLKRLEPQIKRALPESLGLTADRFARIALTTIRNNPKLLECTEVSLMAALMQSAQLGLDPSSGLGQAFIIPRWNKHALGQNKGANEAQFQIGYKGYMQLIRRSGDVQDVIARVVYMKDQFEVEYGLNERLIHKPYMAGDPGPAMYYYVIVKFKGGGYSWLAMSRAQVVQHAFKYSQQVKDGKLTGPWAEDGKDFDGMALKTCFTRLKNWLPLSVDVLNKLNADETVKNDFAEDMTEVVSVIVEDAETGEPINAEFQATQAETETTKEGGQ